MDCEEDTALDLLGVGSLQTNAGPDGAEAFCYEEFSVDRWFRAGGDFFKRVDFNLSASGPPPRTGVTYHPAGALVQGAPAQAQMEIRAFAIPTLVFFCSCQQPYYFF